VTLSAVTCPKLNLQIEFGWTAKVTSSALTASDCHCRHGCFSSRAVSSRPRIARDHRALATLWPPFTFFEARSINFAIVVYSKTCIELNFGITEGTLAKKAKKAKKKTGKKKKK
jgi:hypothetical protein